VYAWHHEGGSISQYCKAHNLRPASFHYWKKKLLGSGQKEKPSGFKIIDMDICSSGTIEYIHPSGVRIVFHSNIEAGYLKQLLH
jgi:hypothetical protein